MRTGQIVSVVLGVCVVALLGAAIAIAITQCPFDMGCRGCPGAAYLASDGTVAVVPPGLHMTQRPPLVKPKVAADMRALWGQAMQWFHAIGVPAVAAYGTLLGAARHQGRFIPWDDDMDVWVHTRDACTLVSPGAAATARAMGLALFTGSHGVLKVVRADSHGRPSRQTMYPFVDVFWLHPQPSASGSPSQLAVQVLDRFGSWTPYNREVLRHDDVYPLRQVAFEGAPSWVPHDPRAVLTSLFGPSVLHTVVAAPSARSVFVNHKLGTFLRGLLRNRDTLIVTPGLVSRCQRERDGEQAVGTETGADAGT